MEKQVNVDLYVRKKGFSGYDDGWDQITPLESEWLIDPDNFDIKVALLVEPIRNDTWPRDTWRGMPTLPESIKKSAVYIEADRAATYLSKADYAEIGSFENLLKLSLRCNQTVRIGQEAISTVASLHRLDSIDLTRCRGRISAMCSNLPSSLRHLYVNTTRFGDKAIDAITCENLESLEIYQTPVTNGGVKSLKRFSNLRKLCISGKRVDFEALGELPGLEELTLTEFQAENPDFSCFSNLSSLSVSNCEFGNVWLDSVNPAKLLKLDIYNTSTLHSHRLERFVNLEKIGIHGNVFADEMLWMAAKGGKLKRAYATEGKIRDETVRSILQSEAIEQASFSFTGVTDACLAFHPKSRLAELSLDETAISDAGVREIAKLPQLSTLGLIETQVTDESCRSLSSVNTLRRLYLESPEITDRGAEYLKNLTNLEALLYSGPGFTDMGLASFKGLDRLRFFVFAGSSVTKAGAENLQASLPYCVMSF